MLPIGKHFLYVGAGLPLRAVDLFPLYDHVVIVVQGQIAQIVDKVIGSALFGGVQVGNKIEIKILVQQAGPGCPCLTIF